MNEKVAITGGTGFIGQSLLPKLLANGYDVVLLSRSKTALDGLNLSKEELNRVSQKQWDLVNYALEKETLKGVDHIIHLAGEGIINKRWTTQQKKVLLASRIEGLQLLFKESFEKELRFKTFVSMSAIGFYGQETSEKIQIEEDLPSTDFLGQLCEDWEAAADQFREFSQRIIKLRTGVVLSSTGGAFIHISRFFKLGLAAHLGSGKQYMPWIHLDDLTDLLVEILKNEEYKGVYNVVSPAIDNTHQDVNEAIAQFLGTKIRLPNVPKWFLKFVLGEMHSLLTEGSRVSSSKLEESGFTFKYPTLAGVFRK